MSNAAKKMINEKKLKKQNLKLIEKQAVHASGPTLEELLKIYPGLSFDSASLLSNAHRIFRKTAA